MAALDKERDTHQRTGIDRGVPVAADAVIFKGALVCQNAGGFAVPGSVSATLVALGRAEESVDNTGGANGDVLVPVRGGIFRWANDGTDPVTRAHIDSPAYVLDDQTVSSSHDTNARSAAGIVFDVDASGVWVRTGLKG